MSIYKTLAIELLKLANSTENEWSILDEDKKKFGLKYKRNYTGLMANIKPKYLQFAKDKQGYYDFVGITGPWYKITHDTLLTELLNRVTFEDCVSVWKGVYPSNINNEKKQILRALAILMFEQEVNFGNEIWQRKSHFNPTLGNPNERRPRDLLMGYIKMVFHHQNVNCVANFKNEKGLLLPPKDPKIKETFFNCLENDPEAEALMYGEILQEFQSHIETQDINKDKMAYYRKLKKIQI
jgi:hypothetical protein